jgi:hypothetical protein
MGRPQIEAMRGGTVELIRIRAIPQSSYYPSYPTEHVLVEAEETSTAYFGKPRDNAHCPRLEWPKYAWERIPLNS